MTLDAGRMRTCRFPRFSALKSERRQSLSTEILMCLCVCVVGVGAGVACEGADRGSERAT